jgi:hypothetical protein
MQKKTLSKISLLGTFKVLTFSLEQSKGDEMSQGLNVPGVNVTRTERSGQSALGQGGRWTKQKATLGLVYVEIRDQIPSEMLYLYNKSFVCHDVLIINKGLRKKKPVLGPFFKG